jgi:hypothetical protein
LTREGAGTHRYPCPCCGYVTFENAPGSYDICEICIWEDDISQLRFPDQDGGANEPSLIETQRNFAEFGACEQRLLPHVRKPLPREAREPGWRPVDLSRDPPGRVILYYWRIP